MEEGAETSEEEWQHHGGLATSWRTGNIMEDWQHQRRSRNIKGGGEEIKDFRVWLTPCVVTSWKDLQLKIIHFYNGHCNIQGKAATTMEEQ